MTSKKEEKKHCNRRTVWSYGIAITVQGRSGPQVDQEWGLALENSGNSGNSFLWNMAHHGIPQIDFATATASSFQSSSLGNPRCLQSNTLSRSPPRCCLFLMSKWILSFDNVLRPTLHFSYYDTNQLYRKYLEFIWNGWFPWRRRFQFGAYHLWTDEDPTRAYIPAFIQCFAVAHDVATCSVWRNLRCYVYISQDPLRSRKLCYTIWVAPLAASAVNLTHDLWKTQFIRTWSPHRRLQWIAVVRGLTIKSFGQQLGIKATDLGFNWWLTGLLYASIFTADDR